MDASVKLATCGETVAIWSLPEASKAHQILKQGKVTCSSWSYDGSSLATCGTRNPGQINITTVRNTVCSTSQIAGPFSNIQAIQHPKTSQKYLCVAGEDRVVLYDIAKQKIRQDFRKVYDVTCLATNHNDKYIAAGTASGGLYILNASTGKPAYSQTLKVANDDVTLTAVKFNRVKHSMIGASSDAGIVALWDVNAGKELHAFREHKAPSSGLAFSPVNEVLVLSAGLDKRCVCYDTMTKKPASTICTDLPLTSVDFALDGTNLVLGTSQGLVYLYDLRSFTSPVAVLEAHDSAVSSVLFQPGGNRNNISSLLSSMSKSSMSSISSSVRRISLKENQRPEDSNTSLGSQVFSPLRDTSNIGGYCDFATTPQLSSHSRLSTDSVFSPLRETSFNLISPVTNLSGAKKFSTTPQLSSIREEVGSSPKTTTAYSIHNDSEPTSLEAETLDDDNHQTCSGNDKNEFMPELKHQSAEPRREELFKEDSNRQDTLKISGGNSDKDTFSGLQSVVVSATTPFYMPKAAKIDLSQESGSAKKPAEPVDVRALLTAFPNALSSGMNSPTLSRATTSKCEKATSDFDAFQREFVQNAVEEAMDEFCSDMRKQMWHFHYDMLMAFQRQQMEVKTMLKDYAVNEALLEEVERLREENARLKNTPFVAHFTETKGDSTNSSN